MGLFANHQISIAGNKRLISTTTATDDIHQSLVHQFTHLGCHRFGRLVVETHRIGKSGIRIGRDIIRCHTGQLSEEGFHLRRTKRTVQSDGEDRIRAHAGEEGFERLTTQRTTCQITHRHREHDGQFYLPMLHHPHRGIDGHLGIERIKDCLYQQGIHPTLYESIHLFLIGRQQRIVVEVSGSRVTHIRRHRAGLVRGADRSRHKARLIVGRELIRRLSRDSRSCKSHIVSGFLQMIVGLGDTL